MSNNHNRVYQKLKGILIIMATFVSLTVRAQYFQLDQCLTILDSLYESDYQTDLDSLRASTYLHLKSDIADSSLAKLAISWAYLYEKNLQFDSALVYYETATRYRLKQGDTLKAAHAIYGQAGCLTELQEHITSTNKYLEAISYYEKFGTEGDLADTYNALANNYYYAGDEHIAIDYYRKAIDYYSRNKDVEQLGMIYSNMASAFNLIEENDSSMFYYKKALSQVVGTEFHQITIGIYHGLGILKESIEDYPSAFYYYQRALEMSRKHQLEDMLGFSLQYMGYYFLSQNQYDSAIYYALKASDFSREYNLYLLRYNSYDLLHQVYSKLGKYRQAYEYLDKLKKEDDSLFTLNKARQINLLSKQFETEKSQKELLERNLEIERYKSSLKAIQNIRTLLIVGLVAMFAIVILVFRNERIKARVNKLLQKKNDEVLAKNRQILKIEEAKSKWFINVSHELRTPLSLIKGPLQQIAKMTTLGEANKRLIEIANRNVNNLERLIDEILDLSRIESGDMKLDIVIFDLISWLRDVAKPYKETSESRRISIEINSTIGQYFFVKLDQSKFGKVVHNLFSNALKFTEDGGSIAIKIDKVEEGFRIIFKDTGIGISKGDIPFIFEKFYQATNRSLVHDQGTGVGLSLSKEIIELHKGYIEVQSRQKEGTQFIITLPQSAIASENEYIVPAEVDKSKKYLEQTILVVEDNPDMQEFVRSFLQLRFDVISTMNAQDALEVIEKRKPNLIITDLMMPKMDGALFVQRIKEQKEHLDIPIIVISAISDEQRRLSLLRLGVDDYMVKPFNPEELMIKVENILINKSVRKSASSEEDDIEEMSFEDRLVKDLEQKVKENISDVDFNVTRLAEEASLSERQLYRYLNHTTKMTPANFIKEIRLQRAFELARRNVYATTAELSYAVGFQHPSYFATVFKKRFGKRPSDYMKEKSA